MADFDLAIVGCGPAGALAASTAARAGLSTILVEAQDLPAKKACAEAVPSQALQDVNISSVNRIILNKIDGALLFSPSEKIPLQCRGSGFIIDKERVLSIICEEAESYGAKLRFNTHVVRVNRKGSEVEIESNGKMPGRFTANFLIGADGTSSLVSRQCFNRSYQETATAVEYIVDRADLLQDGWLEIYVGQKKAPKGYAWIFPRADSLNVGVGVKGSDARLFLDRFIQMRSKRFSVSKRIKYCGATVPIGGQIEQITDGRVILAGDAAGQVFALTGAGIHTSLQAGRAAAKAVVQGFHMSNPEEYVAAQYLHEVNSLFGRELRNSRRALKLFWKLSDKDIDGLSKVLEGTQIVDLAMGGNPRNLLAAFLKHPFIAMNIMTRIVGS